MEGAKVCWICQEFEAKIGHETRWCPNDICKKCGKMGHNKLHCKIEVENLQLPNEIWLKIFELLAIKDLARCAQTSKRFLEITKKQFESLEQTLFNVYCPNSELALKLMNEKNLILGQGERDNWSDSRFISPVREKPDKNAKDWQLCMKYPDDRRFQKLQFFNLIKSNFTPLPKTTYDTQTVLKEFEEQAFSCSNSRSEYYHLITQIFYKMMKEQAMGRIPFRALLKTEGSPPFPSPFPSGLPQYLRKLWW